MAVVLQGGVVACGTGVGVMVGEGTDFERSDIVLVWVEVGGIMKVGVARCVGEGVGGDMEAAEMVLEVVGWGVGDVERPVGEGTMEGVFDSRSCDTVAGRDGVPCTLMVDVSTSVGDGVIGSVLDAVATPLGVFPDAVFVIGIVVVGVVLAVGVSPDAVRVAGGEWVTDGLEVWEPCDGDTVG